jgi:hypothetical protein
MKADWKTSFVFEDDFDAISNLCAQERPQDAKMPPMIVPQFEALESRFGIFAI